MITFTGLLCSSGPKNRSETPIIKDFATVLQQQSWPKCWHNKPSRRGWGCIPAELSLRMHGVDWSLGGWGKARCCSHCGSQ
eukprot:3878128-Rhodomonas_salina.2